MGAVTAWAKTGPSGPKYQVNFGDQVSYLKWEDSLFEPPSSRWPNKSSISRNGNWSCLNASPSCKHPRRGRGHCSNHSEGNEIRFGPFGRRKGQLWKDRQNCCQRTLVPGV